MLGSAGGKQNYRLKSAFTGSGQYCGGPCTAHLWAVVPIVVPGLVAVVAVAVFKLSEGLFRFRSPLFICNTKVGLTDVCLREGPNLRALIR